MTRYYARKTPGWSDNLAAGLAAGVLSAVVGAVTFYLVRLTLARKPVEPRPLPSHTQGTGADKAETLPSGPEEGREEG